MATLHNPGVAKLCISMGADVNAKVSDSWHQHGTPLHFASRGSVELTELLLAAGANVNARNQEGNTPLHIAHSVEVAELLVAAGADIESLNEWPSHRCTGPPRWMWLSSTINRLEAWLKILLGNHTNSKAHMSAGNTLSTDCVWGACVRNGMRSSSFCLSALS
eukprot:TRINITY_DN11715_c0_g1_i15.p2 TRINITY_DN11715_c0_g1~~TRINITY_DN11715_c0_g1_i15.p2  ORF type:complete len:163 (+),score=15.11 TRINITY_DN11715_c0_g1_i15:858-1346(+)